MVFLLSWGSLGPEYRRSALPGKGLPPSFSRRGAGAEGWGRSSPLAPLAIDVVRPPGTSLFVIFPHLYVMYRAPALALPLGLAGRLLDRDPRREGSKAHQRAGLVGIAHGKHHVPPADGQMHRGRHRSLWQVVGSMDN